MRALLMLLALGGGALAAGETRPFLLGFTRWPADLTPEGIAMAQDFAHAQGDIVSVMMIGGIPWQESLDGTLFSKDVETNLAYRPPAGKKLFLSISPLNMDRSGVAPYWGEKDNLPLPTAWAARALNSSEVKRAFLNFTLRSIRAMKPDYLAIGIELNVLLSKDRTKWEQLKELHRETYISVKAAFPDLPVCFTTEVLHYKKLNAESKNSEQEKEVADLMRFSDIFAMSFYPHMSYETPKPLPTNFLDFARGFLKPIAVSECGMTSRDVVLKSFNLTLRGSDAEQTQFVKLMLETAARDKYLFAVQFATTDFEKLCAKLPSPVDDVARIWAYTGLQTDQKTTKPAFKVWESFLKREYRRAP